MAYSLSGVKVLPFPAFEQRSPDDWIRRWRLHARHVTSIALESIAARVLYDVCGLPPRVESTGGGCFIIEVRSRSHAGSDEIMFATRRFFRECERQGVVIESIEDRSREEWSAWLGSQISAPSKAGDDEER